MLCFRYWPGLKFKAQLENKIPQVYFYSSGRGGGHISEEIFSHFKFPIAVSDRKFEFFIGLHPMKNKNTIRRQSLRMELFFKSLEAPLQLIWFLFLDTYFL